VQFLSSHSHTALRGTVQKYAALPSDPEYDSGVSSVAQYSALPDAETDVDDETSRTVGESLHTLPFGLYANMLTGAIGLCTFAVLWIPIPLLHWMGAEEFALPSNLLTVISISGIALSGMVFNAGFMVYCHVLLLSYPNMLLWVRFSSVSGDQ
jgi:hypothetical protein